ncbi:hypothetical protein NHQ30_005787 [Ciborinia camelliae]|nr:hypothetical protein NHQ30_005787 [Ciborinia camelliae]
MDASHAQFSSARSHQRNSHLGHYRIQDSRYCTQRTHRRNNLAAHPANQAAMWHRPNHHFLVKSKHLKEYLLTSLRSHIERIEEWLPDDENSGDDSDDGSHNVERKDGMDWQPEPEIVVQGYVWSSEVLPVKRSSEDLEITTAESGHEKPCHGVSSGGCKGVGWDDRKNDVTSEMDKSKTVGHERSLSQLAF